MNDNQNTGTEKAAARKPAWLKVRLDVNRNYRDVKNLVRGSGLHTVCEEARCPNIHECWAHHRTATFMVLGEVCTRACRFCAVSSGRPAPVDPEEPGRVASAVAEMGLAHVVITMVTRDDLPDGGAEALARTVRAVHDRNPGCTVEVLSSDLGGEREHIRTLCGSGAEIVSHNLETVRRLTKLARSRSDYDRSLSFLTTAKELSADAVVKSSLMLGLGETKEELLETMDDLLAAGVTVLNLGQYLQPTRTCLPVAKYWSPEEFAELRGIALGKGFLHCEAGPFVRSSYHAAEQYRSFEAGRNAHSITPQPRQSSRS